MSANLLSCHAATKRYHCMVLSGLTQNDWFLNKVCHVSSPHWSRPCWIPHGDYLLALKVLYQNTLSYMTHTKSGVCSIIAPFCKKVERTCVGPLCKLQVEANLIHMFVSLRYVVAIWFMFRLLPIIFTQQISCCISKSMMKYLQKWNWKLNLFWFSYAYRKCMFVDFLIGYYISPSNCVHFWI